MDINKMLIKKNNLVLNPKGFTLVELLIVIAILAALAAIIVLVINPGELLAQARDAQRISDMGTISNAISLFIINTTATTVDIGVCPTGGAVASGRATFTPNHNPFIASAATPPITVSASNAINGTGWVDVNFTNIAGGLSPLTFLPIDPVNDGRYFYAYACRDAVGAPIVFELNTRLESARHRTRMTNDGGNRNTCNITGAEAWVNADCFFEYGTDPGLDL